MFAEYWYLLSLYLAKHGDDLPQSAWPPVASVRKVVETYGLLREDKLGTLRVSAVCRGSHMPDDTPNALLGSDGEHPENPWGTTKPTTRRCTPCVCSHLGACAAGWRGIHTTCQGRHTRNCVTLHAPLLLLPLTRCCNEPGVATPSWRS